ncbi:MAG: GYD domain-containing protein [Parcubacteria group bacterium]
MTTFIMLTRLSHLALRSPASLGNLNREVTQRIRAECPEVEWRANYAVLGPADYLDIFAAPDVETAMKVATIIRTFGHATTEVWGATEWEGFLGMTRQLSSESLPEAAQA